MQLQVSLIIDLDATANLASMEQQIQAAGHQWTRQALQQAVRTWEQQHPAQLVRDHIINVKYGWKRRKLYGIRAPSQTA